MQHVQTSCNLLGKKEFKGISIVNYVYGVHRCHIENADLNSDDKNFKADSKKSKQGYNQKTVTD